MDNDSSDSESGDEGAEDLQILADLDEYTEFEMQQPIAWLPVDGKALPVTLSEVGARGSNRRFTAAKAIDKGAAGCSPHVLTLPAHALAGCVAPRLCADS